MRSCDAAGTDSRREALDQSSDESPLTNPYQVGATVFITPDSDGPG